MKKLIAGAALLMATPAMAGDKAPVPEPATHPDWNDIRRDAELVLSRELYDPESARITWTRGMIWTSWKRGNAGLLNKRKWGWLACGTINGKNLLGGYAGEKKVVLVITPEGKMTVGRLGDTSVDSDCVYDSYRFGEVVPEFAGRSTSAGTSGMADELAKLADLRGKGILSEEEFQAQKAKLLAR